MRTYICTSWVQKRQRNQRSNCQHPLDHSKKQESSRKTSTALLTTPKPLTLCSEGGVRFPVPGIWVGWWLASANPSHHGLCMLLFSPCHQHENKPRLAGCKMRRPHGAESLLKPLPVSQGTAGPPAGGRQECAQIHRLRDSRVHGWE